MVSVNSQPRSHHDFIRVIASAAKQPTPQLAELWIASLRSQ
jgi:hypothetical protein